ncbi:hypothetical protein K523DRAFT_358706 [Schizophyllum commune Tattone D]|nr:hypothetical protein K523DRAFT_358706 [Schizophyllum commune Tattone D]
MPGRRPEHLDNLGRRLLLFPPPSRSFSARAPVRHRVRKPTIGSFDLPPTTTSASSSTTATASLALRVSPILRPPSSNELPRNNTPDPPLPHVSAREHAAGPKTHSPATRRSFVTLLLASAHRILTPYLPPPRNLTRAGENACSATELDLTTSPDHRPLRSRSGGSGCPSCTAPSAGRVSHVALALSDPQDDGLPPS